MRCSSSEEVPTVGAPATNVVRSFPFRSGAVAREMKYGGRQVVVRKLHVLQLSLLALGARTANGGGGHTSECDASAIDEVTEACCEPVEICAGGVPTRCTDGCAPVYARFYRDCQAIVDAILESMPDDPEQYDVLNTQCIDRLETSPLATRCEDDPRSGRRGCGSATVDRPATAQESGHESHCIWAHVLERCPATCSPACSAPSTPTRIGGQERLGMLAHMENKWFHVDTTAGSFRVEFTDGRVDGIPVLGPADVRDPLVRLSIYASDGIVRLPTHDHATSFFAERHCCATNSRHT
eukprot:COSAG02_NODE_1949_length_10291_cov_176.843505_6_plen_296_part_00